MFMYLQKNKKGFTLIELMVVVAIIGVLALLGLRLYTGQQQKAKEAIVKANAGTIQTLIQAELADKASLTADEITAIFDAAQLRNPFNGDTGEDVQGDGEGQVRVSVDEDSGVYTITGHGAGGVAVDPGLTARR